MAKKILLADDSITIQKVISITFASENYELIIVGDGESAVKRAKESRPDLIMADVAMPGKNGYEVCEAVKNDPSIASTPVLLLAGTFEPLDRAEAERVKADDSIVKPFESQQLLNKVAGLLENAPERESESEAERPRESEATGFGAPEAWGDGDFIGFPEELPEKTAFKGADQLPDLDFLDNGGNFEEPEKELASGEGFTDLEFDESDELGRADSFTTTSAPSWKADTVEEAAIEPEAVKEAPVEPAERPFWAENVSREESFAEAKDISEFPDLYDEGPVEAEEAPAAPVAEEPEPAEEPAEESMEESFEKSFEAVESSFGGGMADKEAEAGETAAEVEDTPAEAPAFERPAQNDEPIEAPDVYEPAPPAYSAPAVERVEEAVVEKATERLQSVEVPREELEEAVRKAVREVVQEIAWEVVPELAEELIRAEIDKVKDALTRLK